jgi:hypothetical protein
LKNTAKAMQTGDLLDVTPEALVKAIVRRRKALASTLPKELERRTEENDRAYALAKPPKGASEKDEQNPEVEEENETFRRRTVSRLWSVRHAVEDTEEALAFWTQIETGDWGHLLEDARRVEEGGKSSYALRKKSEVDEV